MGQDKNMQGSIVLSPVGMTGSYASPKKSKKKIIIIAAIVAVVVAVIVIIIVSVLNKIKKEQNDKIFGITQEYVAVLYNDLSVSDYQTLMQENPDIFDDNQNWLVSKIMNSNINDNIDKKRALATKLDASFANVSALYKDYSYKNKNTDDAFGQSSELKDVLILYLAAGKKDEELKSYYSDKEIDTDINTLQEKFSSNTSVAKNYYGTLLNFRKSQKKYLNQISRHGCLKPSGIDTVCVEYMPKDSNYGSIKAQYNAYLFKVKEQGNNLAKSVVNSAKLLNGIGL